MGRLATVFVAALVAASTLLPLATYRNLATGHTTTFHGGVFAVAVACCAVVAAGLSFLRQVRFRLAAAAVASTAVVLAVAAALTRIKLANDTANRASAPSHTAYAPGAVLGIVAAIALLILGVMGYADTRRAVRG